MRKPGIRFFALVGGSLLSLALLVATQPDVGLLQGLPIGADTLAWALGAAGVVCSATVAWLIRKALHPYPEADMQSLFRVAAPHPIGAGLSLVALAIVFLGLCMLLAPLAARAQGVPPQAEQHLPTVRQAIQQHWPSHPWPAYFGGLIEHETCATPAMCWSPAARLKTPREEGLGWPQLTRTWRADGSLRFDTLTELRGRHTALRELSWDNLTQRPDLQAAALVLYGRELFEAIAGAADVWQQMAFADVGYNGGPERVRQDRRACGLKAGCRPDTYWGHVEHTCTAGRQPLYGRRSACDINRHHVRDVIQVRAPRYESALAH